MRSIRVEAPTRLVQAITDARAWLADLVSGWARDTRDIALREASATVTSGRQAISPFSPDIARAVTDGTLPDGVGVERLNEVGTDWA